VSYFKSLGGTEGLLQWIAAFMTKDFLFLILHRSVMEPTI